MRSDGLQKSDLIRSRFTLFAPSETQRTKLSSWRGNWNYVRAAQIRVADLRSSVGPGTFSSEINIRACQTAFKSYETQRPCIFSQERDRRAIEVDDCG